MAWSWLDRIMERGTTDSSAVPDDTSSSHVIKVSLGEVLCAGAVCWAAWRYFRYITCLRTYGRDMTAMAGKADPNCAALVGAARVRKTAIAEGSPNASSPGRSRPSSPERVSLSSSSRRWWMKGAATRGKVILFVDEMHMLLGAGAATGTHMDAANMLKPALARGHIRCLGGSQKKDPARFSKKKDPVLERRFRKVHVEQPSTHSTIAILQGLKPRYQKHYGLEILDAAVHLADRYIAGMHDNGARRRKYSCCAESCCTGRHARHFYYFNSVCLSCSTMFELGFHLKVVSGWIGIPIATLNQEESVKLIHLADRLHKRVVGKDEAVNLVAEAVLRSRVGLHQAGQPIGSFLFWGTTGVGKTELVKALAEQLFDSEKMRLRFDMYEYVSPESVLRLVGAPPSYHGCQNGGQLIEKVRRRPYSVILFDEVEKAYPSVLIVFLQLLDDGVLTDGKGHNVDFKNRIIIMTSNVGAEHLNVQKCFKPEFLNRLSEIVVFEPLLHCQLKEIVNIQMKSAFARVAGKGISLVLSDAALDVNLSESHNPLPGTHNPLHASNAMLMLRLSSIYVSFELGAMACTHNALHVPNVGTA
uniref:AAA+ ATPase domain-containing protein n=1 Tax=Triticum aestivum TaxID=4565 RepID=A0A077RTE9_WHEAT|nr:unnamed protein product [Triticum aestivum]